jgi:hypothetical protein
MGTLMFAGAAGNQVRNGGVRNGDVARIRIRGASFARELVALRAPPRLSFDEGRCP